MGARRVLVASMCAVAGLLSAFAVSASAKLVHPYVASFGSFSDVQGIAADASGNVYVYDGGTGTVYKYDASGEPVDFAATASNSISGVGFASSDEGEIAVDGSSGVARGDIYIAHAGGSINIYSAEGEKLGELTEGGHPWGEACGVAVDALGNVYVGLYSSSVNKYVPSTNPVADTDYSATMGGLNGICNIAADSAGNVFAVTWSNGPVTRYEPSQFGSLSASGSVVDGKGSTLVVDPANDEVYVDEKDQIAQYGAHGEPFEAPTMTFASSGEGAVGGSLGIAVGPANHEIYVSDGKGKISVFGPALNLPTVATGEASSVTHTEASIAGTVNPEGVAIASCQFEYGATTSYGHVVSCSTNPGSGNAPVAESVIVSGLEPGTVYHYRLVASTAGGDAAGADHTFKTEILWPETTPGLSDGRVYEEVTPANKGAGQAEAPAFVVAGTDGDEVAFTTRNGLSKTPTGLAVWATSHRTPGGWSTRGAMPRAEGQQDFGTSTPQLGIGFSSDVSETLFGAYDTFVPEQDPTSSTPHLYIYGEDGSITWVGKPTGTKVVSFRKLTPGAAAYARPAGASPDLKTVYFAFEGTLTPADEEPNPALGGISRVQHIEEADQAIEEELPGTGSEGSNDGFFEWHDGVLESAGALPDGHLNPYGAAPAGMVSIYLTQSTEWLDNQVSEDGNRAFFVSPDPAASTVSNPACTASICTAEAPQLYVREPGPDGTKHSVLASRDLLLPDVGGLPAGAPHGALGAPGHPVAQSFGLASLDGSHVFFQSIDQLTAAAPADEKVIKAYDFDTLTNTLTYMPGVSDEITPCGNTGQCSLPLTRLQAVSRDGSVVMFEREGEYDLWREGKVTEIAPVQAAGFGQAHVTAIRAAPDGSEFVFQTNSAFSQFGFNNGSSEQEQVYLYQTASGKLSCLSCPPKGVALVGISKITNDFPGLGAGGAGFALNKNRAVSEDGHRVFFDTSNALVPQDTNGKRDVYEWENGTIYLLSTGVSKEDSFVGDNSPNGNDVFFVTTEGLVSGDVDGSYDVYDARVPRPGDQLPPSAVPCEGSVCQGPPSVPRLFSPPGSETFNGAGNLAPAPAKATVKSLSRKRKLARALRACRHKHGGRKRKTCERRARKAYGARPASVRNGKATSVNAGRSK